MKWTPDKIIALVLIIGCFVLIMAGRNTNIIAILAMAAAYFFGVSIEHYRQENAALAKRDHDDEP